MNATLQKNNTIVVGMARELLNALTGDLQGSRRETDAQIVARLDAFLQDPAPKEAPPQMPERIVVATTTGAWLDYWTAQAMGLPVSMINEGGQLFCVVTNDDGRRAPCSPSSDLTQAGLLLGAFKFELHPPQRTGEPWEAWYDPSRIPGAPGSGVTVCAGADWPQAICRAKVTADFGAEFDPRSPVRHEAAAAKPAVVFGIPTAIVGAPPQAA